MGFKAIITIDLPRVSEPQRTEFYEHLEKKNWYKIDTLTTAWKVTFKDGVDREDATTTIERHLRDAKQDSGVGTVRYAYQLGKGSPQVGEQ